MYLIALLSCPSFLLMYVLLSHFMGIEVSALLVVIAAIIWILTIFKLAR